MIGKSATGMKTEIRRHYYAEKSPRGFSNEIETYKFTRKKDRGKENVKNSKMYPFLKEMAETRSVNRALRLYTGFGGTSYEEMPESVVEVE